MIDEEEYQIQKGFFYLGIFGVFFAYKHITRNLSNITEELEKGYEEADLDSQFDQIFMEKNYPELFE